LSYASMRAMPPRQRFLRRGSGETLNLSALEKYTIDNRAAPTRRSGPH